MLQTLGRTRTGPAPGTYRLDRGHCVAQFSVRHFVVSAVRGTLQPVEGTLVVDADPDASSVRVDLDGASLDTGRPERDAVLTGPRFLDAEQYPRVCFASRRVVGADPARFDVVGDLRVGDRTAPISLKARVASVRDGAVSFAATGRVSRTDLELGWSRAAEAFGLVVGDTVRLTVGAEFTEVAA